MSSNLNNKSATNRRPARRANNKRKQNRSQPLARGRSRTTIPKTFRVFNNNNQNLTLSGTDMFQLQSDQASGFSMTCNILANPLYWYGTRIAGIAKVYQKYRPIHLRFRYVPNCPATTSGSVTIGVIEAGVTLSPETAVTTLLNSGGKNINIYQTDAIEYFPKLREPCYIDGDLAKPIVNPFTFCMYSLKNADTPPGIIYIDWEYEFLQGSGDQQIPIAVITNLTASQKLALLSENDLYNENNLKFGWGAVLGFLKTVGVPILKYIGVVICQSVVAWLSDDSKSNAVMANTVNIREATFLSVDPSDVYTAPAGKMRVKDANGCDYYLPDTARVAIYMSGDQVQVPKAAVPFVNDPGIDFTYFADFTATSCQGTQKEEVDGHPAYSIDFKGAMPYEANWVNPAIKYANYTIYLRIIGKRTEKGQIYALALDEVRWSASVSGVALGDPLNGSGAQVGMPYNLIKDKLVWIDGIDQSTEAGTTAYFNPHGKFDCLTIASWLYKQVMSADQRSAWSDIAGFFP